MAKYVVIVYDTYGKEHTATPVLVEAHGKAEAIAVAMQSASHAWNIGITNVEVHFVLNDGWHTKEPNP